MAKVGRLRLVHLTRRLATAVEGALYSPGACAHPGNPHPPRLGGGSKKPLAKILNGARSPAGFSTRSLAARALRTRHAGPEWNHLRNSRSARSPVLVIRANSQGATELVESLCHGTFRVEKGL